MRRHEQLQPLSREHHQTLRLARVLQRGEESTLDLQAAVSDHRQLLLDHFAEEETAFAALTASVPADHVVHDLLRRMRAEHLTIRALLDTLTESDVDAKETLPLLGRSLAEHVAFEERTLFPALEACCLVDRGRDEVSA